MLGFFLDLKMQVACFFIIISLAYTTVLENSFLSKQNKKAGFNSFFDAMFYIALFTVIFDGLTAAAVNRLDTFPRLLNTIFHSFFFLGLQFFFCFFWLYILSKTDTLPKSKQKRKLLAIPQLIATIITVSTIKDIEYVEGVYQNYTNGIAATTTFVMIFLYCIFAIFHFIRKFNSFERRKRISFILWLAICTCIFVIQTAFRETLLSSFALTLIILVAYEWQENPVLQQLECFNNEVVTSFATLIESKDGSTGGHIKRTSLYVEIIANNLKRTSDYEGILTNDYLTNLKKAAPMHDIGKIGIPDYILQKTAKFSADEYEIMKKHSTLGGDIIKETFGHFGDKDYEKIAYEVAKYHHEKYNGKGYPEGLVGKDIPLSARIMAVADVFDAVSARRCYRDAMSLDESFEIIKKGEGTDFDPDIVRAFFDEEEEVKRIYSTLEIK